MPANIDIEIGTRARSQMQQLLELSDQLEKIHRAEFVLGEPSLEDVRAHKARLHRLIRILRAMHTAFSDSESGDTDLAAQLQLRIRQLELAYAVVDDSKLSEGDAERLCRHLFQ